MAEERNRRTLDKIRHDQLETRQKLVELDVRHQELDALVEQNKNELIDSDSEVVNNLNSI